MRLPPHHGRVDREREENLIKITIPFAKQFKGLVLAVCPLFEKRVALRGMTGVHAHLNGLVGLAVDFNYTSYVEQARAEGVPVDTIQDFATIGRYTVRFKTRPPSDVHGQDQEQGELQYKEKKLQACNLQEVEEEAEEGGDSDWTEGTVGPGGAPGGGGSGPGGGKKGKGGGEGKGKGKGKKARRK